MTKIERVDAALAGEEFDRPPLSFWYHFGLQHQCGERHAEASLTFFEYYDLDFLKVMNDYYHPMPAGVAEVNSPESLKRIERFEVEKSDWNEQLKALRVIAKTLENKAYFIDTVFDPWQTLQRNLAGEHLFRLVQEAPDAVHGALEVVTENLIAYCEKALACGAAGIFISTLGSKDQLDREVFTGFAKPYVEKILREVHDKAIMNTAHIHDTSIFVDDVVDLPVQLISYEDRHPTNPSIDQMKRRFPGAIMGGLDKNLITRVTPAAAVKNAEEGIRSGGATRFLLAPGCSFPAWLFPQSAKRMVEAVKAHGRLVE